MISVPEQIYLLIFTLMLSNQYELFYPVTRKKQMKILLLVFISAFISVVLRTIGGFGMTYMAPIGILAYFILILLAYKITAFKQIIKLLGCIVISFITVMVIQLMFIPMVLYGTSITAETLNRPSLVTFLWTLPERMIELIILAAMITYKYNVYNIKLMQVIWQNRFFAIIFIVLLIVNFFIIYTFSINVYINKMLIGLSPVSQITIIVTAILFPLINLSSYFFVIFFVAYRRKNEQVFIKNEVLILKALVGLKLSEGRYHEIIKILNDFDFLIKDTNKYMQRKGLEV